jgi:hypothetical protein
MKKITSKFWLSVSLFLLLQISISITVEGQQVIQGTVPPDIAKLGIKPTGNLDSTMELHLAIGLPLRNQDALNTLLQQIYDPANPNYHKYLTTTQFTRQFGPTENDYQSLIAYATAKGFTILNTAPNNMILDIKSNVANIERTFNIKMYNYKHPTESRTFFAVDRDPSINLTVPIIKIIGLDNYLSAHYSLQNNPGNIQSYIPNEGSNPINGSYWRNDLRKAYLKPTVTLTGSGQTLGLVALGGYSQSDISTYKANSQIYGAPTPINEYFDGFTGKETQDEAEIEAEADIEMAMAMAPGCQIKVYEDSVFSNLDVILNAMANENVCKTLSTSCITGGHPSPYFDDLGEQIFKQMALQGQSFFCSSGDLGSAYSPDGIWFPQGSPNVTLVGGTILTTNSGSYASEVVWNDPGASNASGGGYDSYYTIPYWQQNISNKVPWAGVSTSYRNIPDVAIVATNLYGYGLWLDQYDEPHYADLVRGGTSCSAPLWAAFTALVNQQSVQNGGQPVGFINPAIYSIGNGYWANYGSVFNDIQSGNSWISDLSNGYTAYSGYDLCTGWGSPMGQNCMNAIVSYPVWSGNVTYSSNYTVPVGMTLVIRPGTQVTFTNGASLIVNGTLTAVGTISSPITFNFSSISPSTQNGIKYNTSSSGNISYCKILNAYNGIYENSTNINVANSAISYCTYGLYLYNSGSWIQSNNIHDNAYGIYLISCSPSLSYNYIQNNSQDGVYCSNSSPIFELGTANGNNLAQNSCGVYCWNNSFPMLGYNYPSNTGFNNLTNTNYNVYNMSSNGVYAMNNWWGSTNSNNFKIAGTGAVVFSQYLTQPNNNIPNPPLNKAGSNLYVSGKSTVPLLSSLDSAYQLIAANNLAGARAICLNMVNNYPDYSLSYNALNLIKETYPANQIDSVKKIYQLLFNNKAKKKIYAIAGLILADIDTANKLSWYDNIINSYSKDSVLELALFDKFVYYNFEKGDKQNALAVSKQLDNLFPLGQGDIQAHIILGDTSYIKMDLAKKPGMQASTIQTPAEYTLLDNYPNPFNPSTVISWSAPGGAVGSLVTLKVYDILGREVKTLVNETQTPGTHSISFDASNLASGVYFYQLRAGSFMSTKKMILTK